MKSLTAFLFSVFLSTILFGRYLKQFGAQVKECIKALSIAFDNKIVFGEQDSCMDIPIEFALVVKVTNNNYAL